jgi:hypothetical protein
VTTITTRSSAGAVAAVFAILLAGTADALAQGAPTHPGPINRPGRMDAAGNQQTGQEEGLVLMGDGYFGSDTNLLATQRPGAPVLVPADGSYVGGFGSARYLWSRRRTLFAATATTDVRNYTPEQMNFTHSHAVTARLQFGLGERFTVGVRQSFDYASFYQIQPVPHGDEPLVPIDPAIPASADRCLAPNTSLGYATVAEVTQTLGPRTGIIYHATRAHDEYQSTARSFDTYGFGAVYRKNVSRYMALRAGYGYDEPTYAGSVRSVQIHNIDTGIDYARPLSFSRRTTVRFAVGPTLFDRDDVKFYRVQAAASAIHDFGRTWSVTGVYNRGVQFVAIVPEPLYATTVSLSTGGLIGGRRLQFLAHAGYSSGQLVLSPSGGHLDTAFGTSSLQWAFTDRLALHGSYSYYRYRPTTGLGIPLELRQDVDRQAFRVAVRMWLPVLTTRGNHGPR